MATGSQAQPKPNRRRFRSTPESAWRESRTLLARVPRAPLDRQPAHLPVSCPPRALAMLSAAWPHTGGQGLLSFPQVRPLCRVVSLRRPAPPWAGVFSCGEGCHVAVPPRVPWPTARTTLGTGVQLPRGSVIESPRRGSSAHCRFPERWIPLDPAPTLGALSPLEGPRRNLAAAPRRSHAADVSSSPRGAALPF